jgi:hypothetical protein
LEAPPSSGTDRFFGTDLSAFAHYELLREHDRITLYLLFLDPPARERWPAIWYADRLERVQRLLQTRAASRTVRQ